MIRRPPRSTLFPTRRSSDLSEVIEYATPVSNSSALCRLQALSSRSQSPSQFTFSAQRSVSLRKFFCKRILRSEEHTSELQSHVNLVCRLLLEKKNIS